MKASTPGIAREGGADKLIRVRDEAIASGRSRDCHRTMPRVLVLRGFFQKCEYRANAAADRASVALVNDGLEVETAAERLRSL